ncbi:MAG: hypothetical protein JXB46_06060 [Candidatus Eisenbacteria bacterium]|nr:hypothetical protein [Candidatus Eisenbacteria bacterium]
MIATELTRLIDACRSAHEIGTDVDAVRRERLTREESDLLTAASVQGRFSYIHPDNAEWGWIRADRKDFNAPSDASYAARYREAFVRLCRRGYVSHTGGVLFELTPAGWERARSQARDVAL